MDLSEAVLYCLEEHGLALQDVDLIVWNHVDHLAASTVVGLLKEEDGIDLSSRPFVCLPHHFAHACCAYYLSSFKEAAIMVADVLEVRSIYLRRHCDGPEPEALDKGATNFANLKGGASDKGLERESFYRFDGTRWQVVRKIIGDRGGIGSAYGRYRSSCS